MLMKLIVGKTVALSQLADQDVNFILAYYIGVIVIMYEDFLTDKCGWVNWYLVGKFVMKNLYALHLFDEMFERYNMENMSFSSNLEALDIVVLVCRSWPKDHVASFTEENGTLGYIHAIKQFLCLSLLQICALTVMAISQLHCSIFTNLLLKLNKEFCNRVDVHLNAVSFPNCVENDQIFQQPGWCQKLNDPCDNISYQKVVFNKRNNTKWLMEKPCILSFMVVEENGKRKAFGFVTSIIRLLEESANLKGLKDGHVRQEQDMFAVLSCKHINDLLKIKAELFPCNFQKLLPIVLCLPLVIEHHNAWKIAILFCDASLDTIVLQFLLELLSVGKASVGIVIGEGTTNENVLDIRTWAILFEDHCFMVEEMLYLAEMDKNFPDDAYLSDALPLNLRKSLIIHTSYFKKVISMVANSLTSSPNLEIRVNLLF
ncbi:hypothetical protein DVH24_035950 [Malus domestica]|uniref:Uncharacterized protein n=1 Tax=Malus domestica TaxID=3750 RepID=A0A498JUS2_MALDO|nr:hypothetical protein DVH24_035950 [Malus domestica]